MKPMIIYDTFMCIDLELFIRNGTMVVYVVDKTKIGATKGQNWVVRRFMNLNLFSEAFDMNSIYIKLPQNSFKDFEAFKTYEDYVKHINRMVMELEEIDNR